MKKFIGFLAVAALIIAGTQVLHRHQNKPLVFPSEKQSLRDAPNDPAASGNSQEGTIIPYEVGDIMGSSPTPIRNMIIVMDGSKLEMAGAYRIRKAIESWITLLKRDPKGFASICKLEYRDGGLSGNGKPMIVADRRTCILDDEAEEYGPGPVNQIARDWPGCKEAGLIIWDKLLTHLLDKLDKLGGVEDFERKRSPANSEVTVDQILEHFQEKLHALDSDMEARKGRLSVSVMCDIADRGNTGLMFAIPADLGYPLPALVKFDFDCPCKRLGRDGNFGNFLVKPNGEISVWDVWGRHGHRETKMRGEILVPAMAASQSYLELRGHLLIKPNGEIREWNMDHTPPEPGKILIPASHPELRDKLRDKVDKALNEVALPP